MVIRSAKALVSINMLGNISFALSNRCELLPQHDSNGLLPNIESFVKNLDALGRRPAQSEPFKGYPVGKPNNLDGLRRSDASRFLKGFPQFRFNDIE